MRSFLLRRVGLTLITLAIVSLVVFFASQVLPGDVGRKILGQFATADEVARLDHKLGVDRPLVTRYWTWLTNYLSGDWGSSYLLNIPVRSLVLDRFLYSLYLGIFALAITIPISIGAGIAAAVHERRILDRAISLTGLSLIAVPEFVTGVIFIVVFAVQLKWLPANSTVPTANPVTWVRELLLPALPLVVLLFGYISRMARAGTIEALRSNYVRTARLKGVPQRAIILRHVLRNALIPTIAVVAVQMAYLVGGLVVIETLFNYPGVGKLIYDSAVGHDIPVLEGTVLLIAALLMLGNLAADILAAALNPRIRLSSRD